MIGHDLSCNLYFIRNPQSVSFKQTPDEESALGQLNSTQLNSTQPTVLAKVTQDEYVKNSYGTIENH